MANEYQLSLTAQEIDERLSRPTKELMYEWNFSFEDEVNEVFENVDDDLTWLTTKSDSIGWEIVFEGYGTKIDFFSGEDTLLPIDGLTWNTTVRDSTDFVAYFSSENDVRKNTLLSGTTGMNFLTFDYFDNGFTSTSIHVYNGCHGTDSNSDEFVAVEQGGCISLFCDTDCPLKSIKIYKITR